MCVGSSAGTDAEIEAAAKDGRRDPDSRNASKVAACGLLRVPFLGNLHAK